MKAELRSRIIASAKGIAHIDLACDILQASHGYTKDKDLGNAIIRAQQGLLDLSDAFRRAGR